MAKTALVILADGFEEIEALTQIDVLRRAGVEVTTAGLTGTRVTGAHDVTVEADVALADAKTETDAVVLPGGMPGAKSLGESELVEQIVTERMKAGAVVAAICAAPGTALARFGVLAGKTATCYPGFEKEFPESATFVEERVVVDGALVTSRAPGTALEFALALVGVLAGQAKAAELRDGMLVR